MIELEKCFSKEINFSYKKPHENLSFQNIVNFIKKAACFGFYKNSDEETKAVMDAIRYEILYKKS